MRASLCALAVCLIAPCWVWAQQTVGWRTDATGRYSSATPVAQWAADKNVRWSAATPNWSNASPVVVGDRIFYCAEPTTLVCASAADGKILWQKANAYADVLGPDAAEKIKQADAINAKLRALQGELNKVNQELKKGGTDPATQPAQKAKADDLTKQIAPLRDQLKPMEMYILPSTADINGYSTSTPVSDGQRVYMVFGNGVVVCYDMEGNRQWAKLVDKPTHEWGHSASPVLVEGKLVVFITKLFGLDVADGKVLWQAPAAFAWGTPIAARVGKTAVVVTPGGEIVRAADGAVLAKGIAALEYNSPILSDGVVYFIAGKSVAMKLPAEAADKLTPEILWQAPLKSDRYYASPVIHDGLIYAITQNNNFSVLDAKNGKPVYEKKLDLGDGDIFPSITLAGNCLLVSHSNGTTLVLQPGREYKEIARNKLEPFRSTPVFVGDRMILRGLKNLYCIGK